MFILIIPFIIKNCLWKLAFASSGTEVIDGYTYNELIIYNIFSMIFAYLNTTYFQYSIATEIKDGLLSRYLVKPINHMLYWLSMLIGDKIIKIIYVLVFIVFTVTLYGNHFDTMIYNIMITIVVMIFSVILNFMLYYAISLLAFWFLEISSFFAAIAFVISMLSGELIPINVMPILVEKILLFLPFSYSVYFPVQTVMGTLTIQEIMSKLVIQIVWIIAIGLISMFVWKAGVKKYESVGG
jgi:ABC-2 type transport system permease protein